MRGPVGDAKLLSGNEKDRSLLRRRAFGAPGFTENHNLCPDGILSGLLYLKTALNR